MDIAFYNRGGRRIIKHKSAAAMPVFYPRSPATVVVAPAAAAAAVPYSAAAPWPAAPAPPPSAVTVVGHGVGHAHAYAHGGGGGGDADVDRRAAMYISRVQERLRRERAASEEYWRNRY